jgi:hypothetical protein
MIASAQRASTAAVVTVAFAAGGCGGDGGGGLPFAQDGAPQATPTSGEVVGCLKTAGRKAGCTVSASTARNTARGTKVR